MKKTTVIVSAFPARTSFISLWCKNTLYISKESQNVLIATKNSATKFELNILLLKQLIVFAGMAFEFRPILITLAGG